MSRLGTAAFATAIYEPSMQVGALCWRKHRGQVQVLLITSRETGRWVIPKGWPHDGATAAGSAAAEAWEEAGVEGVVAEEPVGLFTYDKVLKPTLVQPCVVAVFGLRVARLRAKFPERRERQRKWFDASRAARKVGEPELRALLAAIAETPKLLEPAAPSDVVKDAPDGAVVKDAPEGAVVKDAPVESDHVARQDVVKSA